MDKIELKVTMEPERLDALRYFLSAKEKRTPEKELQRLLEELYEKYVPAPVREYIDESDVSAAAPSKPRRGPRAAAPKPDQEPEGALHRHRITTVTRTILAKMFRPAMTWEVDTMKKSDFFSQDLRSSNRLLSLRHHKDIRYPAPSTYSKQKPAKRRNRGCPNERLR